VKFTNEFSQFSNRFQSLKSQNFNRPKHHPRRIIKYQRCCLVRWWVVRLKRILLLSYNWNCYKKYLPLLLRWSSIITELIMYTLPMLPTTERPIMINSRATRLHSVLSVTGDTASLSTSGPSFMDVVLITDSITLVDVSLMSPLVMLELSSMAFYENNNFKRFCYC